jgi:hypothetical protein
MRFSKNIKKHILCLNFFNAAVFWINVKILQRETSQKWKYNTAHGIRMPDKNPQNHSECLTLTDSRHTKGYENAIQ